MKDLKAIMAIFLGILFGGGSLAGLSITCVAVDRGDLPGWSLLGIIPVSLFVVVFAAFKAGTVISDEIDRG